MTMDEIIEWLVEGATDNLNLDFEGRDEEPTTDEIEEYMYDSLDDIIQCIRDEVNSSRAVILDKIACNIGVE